MHVILVIMDSLRQDHVGAYGNDWIQTPHLDAFAREAVTCTRCYPESLPTLPVRRRCIPVCAPTLPRPPRLQGRFSGSPGWGPIPERANHRGRNAARCRLSHGFVTDCYHQFKPSELSPGL